MVSGFENEDSAEQLGKTLKKKLACGGTTKDKVIELQGDHRKKVKELLLSMGYKEGLIDG